MQIAVIAISQSVKEDHYGHHTFSFSSKALSGQKPTDPKKAEAVGFLLQ